MQFASTAIASDSSAPSEITQESAIANLVPLVLIFIIFYFLMIRPHQKRLREHNSMLDNLRRGDKVITGGGIIGTVHKIENDVITVEIAPEIKVKVSKPTIVSLVAKTGNVAEAGTDGKPGKKASGESTANDNKGRESA